MPGGDRTGPAGQGPMTGKAAGVCTEYHNPRHITPRYGQGFGRGQGAGRGFWGRGRRFWYREHDNIPLDQPRTIEEKVYIENLIKRLEDKIKDVEEKLQNLQKEKKES